MSPLARTYGLTGSEAVELCVAADESVMAELVAGARRPVLVVHALDPPREGGGSLRVRLVGTDKETRIGLFPGGAFSAAEGDEPRRYFLPTIEHAGLGPACYTIQFDAEGGRARVSLEVSGPLER